MSKNGITRLKRDGDIAVQLAKLATECKEDGLEVEYLFLMSMAAFFGVGQEGLNRALLSFGKQMTELATDYIEIIKLLKEMEEVIQRENHAKNN